MQRVQRRRLDGIAWFVAVLCGSAACATKVGDASGRPLTSVPGDLLLADLSLEATGRLCVDVAEYLDGPMSEEDRQRAACMLEANGRDDCRDAFRRCMMAPPRGPAEIDYSRCASFEMSRRGCGPVLVRDYTDCLVKVGQRYQRLGADAPAACDASTADFGEIPTCIFVARHCALPMTPRLRER